MNAILDTPGRRIAPCRRHAFRPSATARGRGSANEIDTDIVSGGEIATASARLLILPPDDAPARIRRSGRTIVAPRNVDVMLTTSRRNGSESESASVMQRLCRRSMMTCRRRVARGKTMSRRDELARGAVDRGDALILTLINKTALRPQTSRTFSRTDVTPGGSALAGDERHLSTYLPRVHVS